MDSQMLMYYSMLNSGGASGDSMLPLILMQLEQKKGNNGEGDSNGNGGMNSEVLDVMLYRPMGERILANFASKISKMNATQRNKLLASLSLDRLSTQQKGKFGETLLLASRGGMMELLGEPLAAASSSNSETKGNGNVGGQTLGNARKSVIEQAKELEVEEGKDKEKNVENTSKANTALHRDVIVT
ncbi:unnamed protein product [marine sediment metagenome]|uniref:Uncharacterized protein n=1 Tax=marine sediment metagenome TaxID=412755 RepID=X1F772_9ZZZZ